MREATLNEYRKRWTDDVTGTGAVFVGREILPADLKVKGSDEHYHQIGYVICSPGGFRYFLKDAKGEA